MKPYAVRFSCNKSHTTFWKSITKVTQFSNKAPILHRDSISFHLSHQPPLSVMCHFLCCESDTFLPKSDIFKARAKRGPSLSEFSDHGGIGASPVGRGKVGLDFWILGWKLAGLVHDHIRRELLCRFLIWPPGGWVYLVTGNLKWQFWAFKEVKWRK